MKRPTREYYSFSDLIIYLKKEHNLDYNLNDLIHFAKLGKLKTAIKLTLVDENGILRLDELNDNPLDISSFLHGGNIFIEKECITRNNEEYYINTNRFKIEYGKSRLGIVHRIMHRFPTISNINILVSDIEQININNNSYEYFYCEAYFNIPTYCYDKNEVNLIEDNKIILDKFESGKDKKNFLIFSISSEEKELEPQIFISINLCLDIFLDEILVLHDDLIDFLNLDEHINSQKQISGKSETAYLNIIGALLETALKSGQFKNQAELIAHLEQHYQGYPGLSESNLKMKFAAANKSLSLV